MAMQRLKEAAEKAKIELSSSVQVNVFCVFMFQGSSKHNSEMVIVMITIYILQKLENSKRFFSTLRASPNYC